MSFILRKMYKSKLITEKYEDKRFYLMTNLTHNSFCICLFQFSTCFEHSSAHHQEIQLYQYDIRYTSLYVGDRLLCRFGLAHQTVIYIE